jgi:molybdopterin molybdotransferase
MTGAPIPKGADTVLKVEDTEHTPDSVRVFKPEPRGSNIRPQGEDVKKGDCIIPKGTTIRSGEAGMLAILAKSFVLVYQRPRVAILSTGDELADLDERFSEEKIINSNSYGIAAAVQEAGGVPILSGDCAGHAGRVERKDFARIECRYSRALRRCLDGGLRLHESGFSGFRRRDEFLEVGDSPRSAACLRKDSGQTGIRVTGESRLLDGDLRAIGPACHAETGREREDMGVRCLRRCFRRSFRSEPIAVIFSAGCCGGKNGVFKVRTTGDQGSGILTSMVKANCLIDIPVEVERINPGDSVTVQLLSGSAWLEQAAPMASTGHRPSCC